MFVGGGLSERTGVEVPRIPTRQTSSVHGKSQQAAAPIPTQCYYVLQVMRGYDGRYATTGLSLIHTMLLTNEDLSNTVASLVENVSSVAHGVLTRS